jgi:hypothetical protein
MEKWTQAELSKYKETIRNAPKSRAKAKERKKKMLNNLFNRLFQKGGE